MNRELASLQVETYNSGEKDFEWDKLTQIPEHQLRSGRIVQKTNVDTPTSDSDHEDNDLPAGIEEFDNQDFINATLLPSGSTLEFLTNLGIPYQDRTLTKRQYCGVLVDTYNNLDSFSATANPITIRLLLTIARANKWHVRCQDISTAYLMAPLPTVVYIRTPKEFQEFCNIRAAYLKILSSVYGLPSSGRNFWKKLCQDLRDFGFKACTSDDCLFLYHDEQGGEIIIALVVDDIIQASNSQALFAKFDDFMMNTKGYSVTTDNDLSFYLGVAYKRDEARGDRPYREIHHANGSQVRDRTRRR
mmetsp:Transcript_17025/g.56320  ORF Transcript_17025/g.56320 Transcript_17025/m.56320 type:complete len:303 (-) Transcript_17025:949-1857(-)